jgi:hypothetical protein
MRVAQTLEEITRDIEEISNMVPEETQSEEVQPQVAKLKVEPESEDSQSEFGEIIENITNLQLGADLTKGLIWGVKKLGPRIAPKVWMAMLPKLAQIATHPVFGRVLPVIIVSGGGGAVAFLAALSEVAMAAGLGWELGQFMYEFLEKKNPALLKKIVTSLPAKATQQAFGDAYNLLGKFINMEGSDTNIQEQKEKTNLLSSNHSIAVVTLFKQLVGQLPQQADISKYAEKYIDLLKGTDDKQALAQLATLILKDKKKSTPANFEAIIQKTIQNMQRILNKQRQNQAKHTSIVIKKARHQISFSKNHYLKEKK